MTYTCTVAWCTFDGRNEAALRRHVRIVHPWLDRGTPVRVEITERGQKLIDRQKRENQS